MIFLITSHVTVAVQLPPPKNGWGSRQAAPTQGSCTQTRAQPRGAHSALFLPTAQQGPAAAWHRGPTAALGLGSCTQGPVCRAGSWRRMGEDGALSCSATTLPGLSGSTGLQLFVGQITPYASTNKNKKFLYVFGEATGFCHASILPFIKESKVLFKLYNSTIKIQCCFHYPNL